MSEKRTWWISPWMHYFYDLCDKSPTDESYIRNNDIEKARYKRRFCVVRFNINLYERAKDAGK